MVLFDNLDPYNFFPWTIRLDTYLKIFVCLSEFCYVANHHEFFHIFHFVCKKWHMLPFPVWCANFDTYQKNDLNMIQCVPFSTNQNTQKIIIELQQLCKCCDWLKMRYIRPTVGSLFWQISQRATICTWGVGLSKYLLTPDYRTGSRNCFQLERRWIIRNFWKCDFWQELFIFHRKFRKNFINTSWILAKLWKDTEMIFFNVWKNGKEAY